MGLRKAQIRARGVLSRRGMQKQVAQCGWSEAEGGQIGWWGLERRLRPDIRTRGKEAIGSLNFLPRAIGSRGRDLTDSDLCFGCR